VLSEVINNNSNVGGAYIEHGGEQYLNSGALMADSKQTELCTYLSAIFLAGLLLNAVFGWWWADPVAALIMVPIIAKEGIEALRGETCCDDACH
jgi:divalent metal cation (Fe/Co/Zn/Cd) transporter